MGNQTIIFLRSFLIIMISTGFRLVCFDNDHAFVPAFVRENPEISGNHYKNSHSNSTGENYPI